MIIMITFINIY